MRTTIGYWFFRLTSALRWYYRARTRYDVHSPHLVEFITEVFRDERYYHAFGVIRDVRRYWRGRRGTVRLLQLGAPSRTTRKQGRSVRSLVASNAIDDRSGRFLFRLALWLRARRIVELGTNAGISTLYLHLADTRARLDTVEGNPAVAALARETFRIAPTGPSLRAHAGLFREWLAGRDPATEPLDLFFIDGDHRYQPTLDYVHALLPEITERSVGVIADIHWSAGMEKAWRELQRLPEVTASVETYHFGLLFFRKGINSVHVPLIRTRYKPWRLGFF